MAPKAPTPDGLDTYDPNAVYTSATAATGSSSSKTDIWNIPPDLLGKTIQTDYGTPGSMDRGARPHLDAGDQQYQADHSGARAPSQANLSLDEHGNPAGVGNPWGLPIDMYGKNPANYLKLQQALFAAGYFGSKSATSMRWGGDTAGTMDAWTALLRETVQQQSLGHNVTWQDVLNKSVANTSAASKAAGTTPRTNVISYTDPQAVAAQAQQAAQAALGRNMTDAELQHFVSEFHAAEQKYGQQGIAINAAQDAGKGGTFDAVQPNLEGEADQYVQEQFGTEAAGNNLADYVGALERMIGG